MIKNYIKTALRNFSRNIMFSLINLVGLAVGLTASIFIFLYVFNEFNHDRFHENSDRIYRTNVIFRQQNSQSMGGTSTAAMGPDLLAEFPEIENMLRFSHPQSAFLAHEGKTHELRQLSYADSSFFDVFTFKLIKGNEKNVLNEPYSLVLSESLAKQIFGDDDPVGEVLRLNNKHGFVVRGIVEDAPSNSTLQYDALASFSTLYTYDDIYLSWDGGYAYTTYILLRENSELSSVYEKLPPFLEKHINHKYKKIGVELDMYFEALEDIHLFTKADGEGSNVAGLITFSAIALMILLIACVNFMNLSTARSAKRSREVGIRKVLGGTRRSLRWQFLTEALIMSFASAVLAMMLVELFLPSFNNIVGKNLSLYSSDNLVLLLGLFLLVILVGILSGSYPAFYLSSVKPVKVLKGGWFSPSGKTLFRNVLVVFQFCITTVLIISTIVIYRQLNHLNKTDLGYEKESIVYFPLLGDHAKESVEVLKNELKAFPFVYAAGATSAMPGWNFTRNGYFPEGYEEPVMINVLDVDEDFLETMDIEIAKGEGFSDVSSLDDDQYLVNQAFVKEFGWKEPIGKEIERNGKHKVIGVVKDFYFAPLYIEVLPLIITNEPWQGFEYLALRMNMNDLQNSLSKIEEKWKSLVPGEPFVYEFMDSWIKKVYQRERNFGKLFLYFSILAILIACLGLLGLAAFMVEQRTREIGIRKVFGASSGNVVRLLSWDFSKLVIISNVIAWPVAWYIMQNWLERFAIRIPLSLWIFLFAGLLAFVLAFITVSYQSLRAANTNPAEVVKYE
ncbi:MAG: ABC transporter permease [Bacteroidales bacterium]|nr:ABC transporter permease [Bacteroidales bacterium]MCF8398452.1 ABC transporter permease [Bacteroidales bacterium]